MGLIISPPDFEELRKRAREEQLALGLSAEVSARKQADDNYLEILEEIVALEEQYKSLAEQLNHATAEIVALHSKNGALRKIAKTRRAAYRRDRRNHRILLTITFLTSFALLLTIGFIFVQSDSTFFTNLFGTSKP